MAIAELISLPVYYVIARWAMVFPATAIDHKGKTLMWSWDLSMGNGLRLFLLVGLVPISTNFILSLFPGTENFIFLLLYQAAWIVVGAFEICLLSLSYSYFINTENQEEVVA